MRAPCRVKRQQAPELVSSLRGVLNTSRRGWNRQIFLTKSCRVLVLGRGFLKACPTQGYTCAMKNLLLLLPALCASDNDEKVAACRKRNHARVQVSCQHNEVCTKKNTVNVKLFSTPFHSNELQAVLF